MNTLIVCTMAPAAVELTRAFGLNSTIWVNLAAMSVAITAIPFSFMAIWAFKKYPTSNVLRIASAVFLAGALFRMYGFVRDEYWPILAGSTISACVCPFFLNVQSVIANKWFSDKERALATAIQSATLPFGAAITLGFQNFIFVDGGDILAQLKQLMVIQNMIIAIVALVF